VSPCLHQFVSRMRPAAGPRLRPVIPDEELPDRVVLMRLLRALM
jgi:hypothetical protein